MAIYYRLDNTDMIEAGGNEVWLFDRETGGWLPDSEHLLSRLHSGRGVVKE